MSGNPRGPPIDDSSDDEDAWKNSKGKGKGKGKSSVCNKSNKRSSSSSKKPTTNHNNNDIDPPNSSSDDDENMDVSTGGGGGGGGVGGNDNSIVENSKSFRRQVRAKYRDVLEDLHANAKDYVDEGNFHITEKLLQVDSLYSSVTQTREAAMDSSTIAKIALLGKQKAQALKTDMFTFKPTEFAEKLVEFNGGGKRGDPMPEDKWKQLGDHVRQYFKVSPAFTCMLGTFERTEYVGKEKIARQRNVADKEDFVKNKTKVKEMDQAKSTNEETTAKMTEHVYMLLKKFYASYDQEPIDFFEFTCDPNSFGKTVENIFYLSFLVREGLAKVFLDDDRLPVVMPNDRKKDKDGNFIQEAPDTTLFNQVLVSFSYVQWKEIVEVYGIETAAITKPQALA